MTLMLESSKICYFLQNLKHNGLKSNYVIKTLKCIFSFDFINWKADFKRTSLSTYFTTSVVMVTANRLHLLFDHIQDHASSFVLFGSLDVQSSGVNKAL